MRTGNVTYFSKNVYNTFAVINLENASIPADCKLDERLDMLYNRIAYIFLKEDIFLYAG